MPFGKLITLRIRMKKPFEKVLDDLGIKKERMMCFLVFNSNSMIAYYRVEIYAVLNLDQQGGMKVQTDCI